MNCKHPNMIRRTSQEAAFPCGQCLPCRINSRRILTHRILLEAQEHVHNSFLTLTYDDQNLPSSFVHKKSKKTFRGPTLSPEHLRKFTNGLRTRLSRMDGSPNYRFYGVGEYGEESQRPHYHLALFGYPACLDTSPRFHGKKFQPCRCRLCSLLSDTWGKGHILLGQLNKDSAQYIAGYVTKKLTKADDPRLFGRYPEFSRSSTKPYGIGGSAADKIAQLIDHYGSDMPRALSVNGSFLPLGRYLSNRINEKSKIPVSETKLKDFEKSLFEMLVTSEEARANPKIATAYTSGSVGIALQLLNAQRCLNLEAQHKLKGKSHAQI